ncbi:MAG: hypothetical protein SH850_13710 [Planctomycetaceae bacterium]|nr:hypothetical protein [Planctomycetaceae bacterium]
MTHVPPTVEVVIDEIPRYERMAPVFKQLADGGASINAIAASYKLQWHQVKQALDFAETGERPQPKSRKTKQPGIGNKPCQYKAVAPEVVRLRDEEQLPFSEIGRRLQISIVVAQRAYDWLRPDAVQEAIVAGRRPERGRSTRLPRSTFETIARLAAEDRPAHEIAKIAGCSRQTVQRQLAKIKAESA